MKGRREKSKIMWKDIIKNWIFLRCRRNTDVAVDGIEREQSNNVL